MSGRCVRELARIVPLRLHHASRVSKQWVQRAVKSAVVDIVGEGVGAMRARGGGGPTLGY